MATVYKVVFRDVSGRLSSAIVSGYYGRCYAKGVTTKPRHPECLLLAFRSENDAIQFRRECGWDWEVWRAKTSRARKQSILGSWVDSLAFWRAPKLRGSMYAPRGTVACTDITLIKRVWPKEGE